MNELESLHLPGFTFPWADACSPHADRIEHATIEWAKQHQLIANDEVLQRVIRGKFGWLAARCYPDSPPELLQPIADFLIWLFLTDDFFFDRVDTLTYQTITNVTAIIDVLDMDISGEQPVFGELALLDICRRLRPQLGAERFNSFAQGVRMTHGAAALQILVHLKSMPIGIRQYESIRRHGGAMQPCLELIDTANGYLLEAELRNRLDIEQLKRHANNVVCWTNDIYSLGIELKQPGQYENMISIYASQGYSLQEGIDRVASRIRAEIDSFLKISDAIPTDDTPALKHYIQGLRYWMSGHQRWVEVDTHRYSEAFSDLDSDQRSIAQVFNTIDAKESRQEAS